MHGGERVRHETCVSVGRFRTGLRIGVNDMLFNADKSHFSSMKIKYTFHSCQQDKKGGYYLSYLHF